ncbi:CDGSH iron-sulfur domain-containing protein 1 [Toxocara canis]|uniref:CDGSH iron-sulfur domain-containing protein 1 n=1 Tax=Toxocara canis TaxID=6265 RepID=A0A0B2V3B6_TOXCA|nr:CDGSH iron-sulfur domain-containing protein 1 [Toxocara canis]
MGSIARTSCPADANCHSKVALYAAGIVVGSALLGYYIGVQITKRMSRINTTVKLSTDKVIDTVDVEDIGDKKVFCRCWKSSAFPYCDGTHNKHNAATGDNVGPLIVKKGDSK